MVFFDVAGDAGIGVVGLLMLFIAVLLLLLLLCCCSCHLSWMVKRKYKHHDIHH